MGTLGALDCVAARLSGCWCWLLAVAVGVCRCWGHGTALPPPAGALLNSVVCCPAPLPHFLCVVPDHAVCVPLLVVAELQQLAASGEEAAGAAVSPSPPVLCWHLQALLAVRFVSRLCAAGRQLCACVPRTAALQARLPFKHCCPCCAVCLACRCAAQAQAGRTLYGSRTCS